MAPPKLDIDPDQVELLAGCFCTNEEIAAKLKCSPDTLTRRYAESLEKGRDNAKASLRRMQFKLAETNPAMAIWLGKIYLGQRDPDKIPFSEEQLRAAIERERLRLEGQSSLRVPPGTSEDSDTAPHVN